MFKPVSDTHGIAKRQATNHQYYIPKAKLEYEHHNFRFRGVDIWEDVPIELRFESNTEKFKAQISAK